VTVITFGAGLLDHLSSDDFDNWSDMLFHTLFPRSFLHWRAFGLGLGNCSLRRFCARSLAGLTAFS
jgi:hypothetical protein